MQEQWTQIVSEYMDRGAPGDQGVLVAMLRHLQQHWGGSIPEAQLPTLAAQLGLKETFLLAVIRRIPSLRLGQSALLELCAGPNCGKHTALAAEAEKLCKLKGIELKYMGCQRMCGKGPNVKYNGRLYHGADAVLLEKLLKEKEAK